MNISELKKEFSDEELEIYPLFGSLDEEITTIIFKKISVFTRYYITLSDDMKALLEDIKSLYCIKNLSANKNVLKLWIDDFTSDIENPDDILSFINISQKMGNNTLEYVAAIPLANDIKKMSISDIRDKYRVKNDLTNNETAQLDMENNIWKDFNETI